MLRADRGVDLSASAASLVRSDSGDALALCGSGCFKARPALFPLLLLFPLDVLVDRLFAIPDQTADHRWFFRSDWSVVHVDAREGGGDGLDELLGLW
jgi:hypothetical protein